MKTENQAMSQEVTLPMQPMGHNLPEEQARPGFGNRRNTRIAWNLLGPKSSFSVKKARITLSNKHKTKGSLWMPQQSMGWPHIWTLLTPTYRTPEHSPTIPKSPPTCSFHPSRLLTEYCIKTLSWGWTLIKKEGTDMKKKKKALCLSSSPSTCFLIWICKTSMNFLTDTRPWARKALSLVMTRTHTGQWRSRSHPSNHRQRQNTRT